MQLQAGFVLESVNECLNIYADQYKKQSELSGLLLNISTFNMESLLNLEAISKIPSIYAVALNILTRGLPTLSSIKVEQYFADHLGLTTRVDQVERGKISFSLNGDVNEGVLFKALHIIDPRAVNRDKYLDVSETDSSFEKDFLIRLIPEPLSFLTQLLQKQRSRESFTRDRNLGRVDLSLEIPYNVTRDELNRYRRSVQIKHHKAYVIEVDGAKYHTELIDDLKDFELAQLSRTVSHITEERTMNDVNDLIQSLNSEPFVQLVNENYGDPNFLTNPLTAFVLAPFAIARLQRAFLQYLISINQSFNVYRTIKLAVLERDFPCGKVAIADLLSTIHALNDLSKTQIIIPEVEVQIFTTSEFKNHPLHDGNAVHSIESLESKSFDLVLDISILHRTGVFKEDKRTSSNTIVVRSSHYTHYKTTAGVFSAPAVIYRDLVTPLQNEIFITIEETTGLLRKFLQDIFRKLDFRVGQLPILNRAMQLKSVIGLLPTGGGKSLTYQLAAMLQPGTTIVIDPIRSLMLDQYNGLKEIGIDKCEFINSTQTTAERVFNQHNLLAKGQLHFLFVSPERFVIEAFRMALDNNLKEGNCFSYAVIDEVHCVSEWGHDFRTPYLNLGDNAQKHCLTYDGSSIPLFGLTATASFDVLADIERELNIKNDDGDAVIRFENSVRDEINYKIQDVRTSVEGITNFTIPSVRERIGKRKQQMIFNLIQQSDRIIQDFNNDQAIKEIVRHSYNSYVSSSTKEEWTDESNYLAHFSKRLNIPDNPFQVYTEVYKKRYNYGIIVFTPHRQGWLGIKNSFSAFGVFDNPEYVFTSRQEDQMIHGFEQDTLGYFMGSGDDENAVAIDKESFDHLKQFKDNEESIMVATKAFGMGIDKSNVRMTIHLNMPQSIESFVQEAGRAGRDGKISTSIILYNDEQHKITGQSQENYHLDKEVLMYFHRNSFKGQVKERAMIHELRSNITFPNMSNQQLLIDQLNDLYGTDDMQFNIRLGTGNYQNRIFINTVTELSVGYVYLDSHNTGVYNDLGDKAFCHQLVDWLKASLLFEQHNTLNTIRNWLSQIVVNPNRQEGFERMLSEMEEGEVKELLVPFTNKFYSKNQEAQQGFELNPEHQLKVMATPIVRELIRSGALTNVTLTGLLRDAVSKGLDFFEFIESLRIANSTALTESLELQRAYCLPRSQSDTAKAIYRLVSIGIIDSYTIDYQNKVYTIRFIKKANDEYFLALENLVSRYSSKNEARRQIVKLKADAAVDIKRGRATVISKCLEYLTTFIYDKIKLKRLQAIDDMVGLCRTSIEIKDPLEQNKYIKDEIYYYFNAKYSRRAFIEKTKNGDLPASMPDDFDNNLGILEITEKYIKLVEDEKSGEFISNVKHLRGSAMRMLRLDPANPPFRILKSFSLFILANTIGNLLIEAKDDLVKALINWKSNDSKFQIDGFIYKFKKKIQNHVSYSTDSAFDDVIGSYYALYYAKWTGKFTEQFIAQ